MTKYFLLLSIVLFCVVALWAVRHVGRQKHRSISQHVAQTRRTSVVFGFVAAFAALLAAVTIFVSILPGYDAGITGYLVYTVIIVCLLTIALVPHVEGTRGGTVHNLAAWGMVYVIPAAMVLALFWPLSSFTRCTTVFLTVVNAILLALAMFRREKYRPVFLYFQSGYLLVFFLFLAVITYL